MKKRKQQPPITIPLHPFQFHCELWVGENYDDSVKMARKRYGISKQEAAYIFDTSDFVAVLNPGEKCDEDLKQYSTIFVVGLYRDCELATIVHESYHLLQYLLKHVDGLKVSYKNQEWGACMMDYIFRQIHGAMEKYRTECP